MSVVRTSARLRGSALVGLAASAVLTVGLFTPLPAHGAPVGEGPFAQVVAAPSSGPIISTQETSWRYVEDDTFPSAGDADALSWTKAGFDDSVWKTGKGTFGGKVSDGNQSADYNSSLRANTKLEMNAPGQTVRVRTYFFRTDFELTAAQLAAVGDGGVLRGKASYDDGAIIYVNGHEVMRGDVPAGSEGLNYASGSSTSLDTADFEVAPEHLVEGTNVVAVEVHNDRSNSSDIWFDLSELNLLTAEEAAAKPTRIILTPTENPTTSQHVTFQGALVEDTVGRIQYRPTAGGDTKQVRAPLQPKSVSNDFGHFSGTLTGLREATEYDYRVSSGGAWSAWQTFETADRAETEFSYLYYGDAQIGLDSTWPKVVDAALETAPDAIGSVHAGDLIDTASNDSQWHNWFQGMEAAAATSNVFAAPGNHEYSGDKLMTAWKAHFEYPHNNPNDSTIGEMAGLAEGDTDVAKQYRAYFDHWSDFAAETVYYADYQGVRFITINATRDTTFLRPDVLPSCSGEECPSTKVAALWTQYQAEWLDHVLENSPSKWNVVTFHQPVYSTSSGRNEPVLREHWVPVFEKHNIDLVQMGHDHTYARGFKDTTATEVEGVTDGPVYIVSNSGAKHYALENDERNVWTNNGATQVQKAARITTYQVIDVADDTLTYKSYIAEIAGTPEFYRGGERLADDAFEVGDLWDEFTVHKTDQGQKAVVEAGMEAPDFEDLTPVPVFTDDLAVETPVIPGERVTLSVAVDQPGAAVQWQVDAGEGWSDLDGETAEQLKLGRVMSEDIGNGFRAVVTVGKRELVSTETVLVDAGGAPVFTTDLPAAVTVKSGDALRLEAEASADSRIRYQWQQLLEGEWQDLAGRTGPVLELRQMRTPAAGYRVVATAGTHATESAVTTVEVVRKATQVTLNKAKLKRGKKAVLRVRAGQAGQLKVVLSKGSRSWKRTIQVAQGATKVQLPRFRNAKLKKGVKVKVKLTLRPVSSDHAVGTSSSRAKVR